MSEHLPVTPDHWQSLKSFTAARIALGRAGISLPTRACLDFQLAHALARDAVNMPLDFAGLSGRLAALVLQSQAENQRLYLQRPDLGRLLNASSLALLQKQPAVPVDAVIVVADGLSSTAIDHHAEPFLNQLIPALQAKNLRLPPVCLVKQGRVAVGDAVAETFAARLCIVLVGERPGLSSPDSMGIYFTYQARSGISTDADRNCISNIHANGLGYQQALQKLLYLIDGAEQLKLSGVSLKDETTEQGLGAPASQGNFLLK
ncbi:ethanolamine ammonia-lyase subunit EutC [Methylosoma difficile]